MRQRWQLISVFLSWPTCNAFAVLKPTATMAASTSRVRPKQSSTALYNSMAWVDETPLWYSPSAFVDKQQFSGGSTTRFCDVRLWSMSQHPNWMGNLFLRDSHECHGTLRTKFSINNGTGLSAPQAAFALNKISPTPVCKVKCTGLTSTVGRADTNSSLGVIDSECNVNGTIVDLDGHPCDAMLALVDPAKNMDKYFILQLIQTDDEDDTYLVYTRWGRTGTKGQALIQVFDDLEGATKSFLDKFREKAALEWDERNNEPTVGNKYRFVTQDFSQKLNAYGGAKWEYWVDDRIDGKTDGWYDYEDAASRQIEQLYYEHAGNPNLSERTLQSGIYEYSVDMNTMTQTNTTPHWSQCVRWRQVGVLGRRPG
jgi:predicted DNA-binding WGR domain protein